MDHTELKVVPPPPKETSPGIWEWKGIKAKIERRGTGEPAVRRNFYVAQSESRILIEDCEELQRAMGFEPSPKAYGMLSFKCEPIPSKGVFVARWTSFASCD